MSYKLADMTGTDTNYKVTGDVTKLMASNISLEFSETIYADSLVITPFSGGDALIEGTDYEFTDSDRDYTAEAKASASDSTWSHRLAKSFTIIRPIAALPLKVSMTYQFFFLTTPTVPVTNSSGTVDFNPDVAKSLIEDVAAIKEIVSGTTESAGFTTATPTVLQYDINGTNSANVVTGESWSVDTFNSKSVIFPVQGMFFKDSVSIKLDDGGGTDGKGTPLVYGTDYACYGVNLTLTAETTDTSGIYTLIKILKQYAGKILVTYHALGGFVTSDIIGQLTSTVEDIKTYLAGTAFLTAGTLKNAALIQTMLQSIQELQTQMRAQIDGATYGDSTTGTAVVKQIRAANAQEHWFTIASLYQVKTGTTPVMTDHDRMLLHVQLTTAKYMADVAISFDRENANYPFAVNVTNVLVDPGFTLFGDVNTTTTIYPKWRVVYNNDVSAFSGAYLQIGLTLPALTETLTVEDRSGTQSTWVLDTSTGTGDNPLIPVDDGFTLPDNASVWSSSGGNSVSYTKMAQTPTGYLIGSGAYALTSFDNTVPTGITETALIPYGFILSDISVIDLYMTDATNRRWVTRIAVSATTDGVSGTAIVPLATTSQGNMGLLYLTLSTNNGAVQYALTVKGAASTTDGIAIRYIVAHI